MKEIYTFLLPGVHIINLFLRSYLRKVILETIRSKCLQSTVFESFCACAMFEFATIISSFMDLRLILIIISSQIGSFLWTFSIQYLVRVLRVNINETTGENKMHLKKNEMKISAFPKFVKLFRYLRSTLSQNGRSHLLIWALKIEVEKSW